MPDDDGNKQNEGTANEAAPTESRDPPVGQTQRSGQKSNTQRTEQWPHLWEALTFFALVIYTGFTALLWSTTRAALEETRKSNDLARQTMEADQRAWLAIHKIEPMPFQLIPGEPVNLKIFFRNSGRVPAFSVFSADNWGTLVKGHQLPDKPPYTRAPTSGALIGPGQVQAVGTRIGPLTAERVNEIRAGERTFVFYGYVVYWDRFGTERGLTHCSEYDPETGGLAFCPSYNWAW